MGRTKNRKKRRLGAIQRQMIHLDPWGKRYYHDDWVETRFWMWCGLEKALSEMDKKVEEFWDQFDDSVYEMVVDEEGHVQFPNTPPDFYDRLKAHRKHILATFTDKDIKGKWYHSKKATYYRKKLINRIKNGHLPVRAKGGMDIKAVLENWIPKSMQEDE